MVETVQWGVQILHYDALFGWSNPIPCSSKDEAEKMAEEHRNTAEDTRVVFRVVFYGEWH